jgi:hypothetical protein
VAILGADAHGRSQIKIWHQKFGNGDLSCQDGLRTGQPPLTLGPQLAAFVQKYPSVRVLAKHFLKSVSTIQEILRRELGLKIFSRCSTPHFMSPTQNVVCVEASTEMLRILHESEENHFEGLAIGDESWFQYSYPSSKMFA